MNRTTNTERVRTALSELRAGRMVIVVDDYDRENEGDLVCAAQKVTPQIINFMASHARGLICVPLTATKAQQLGLSLMVDHASDTHATAFTVSVDASTSTTGISASERAQTVRALSSDSTEAGDLHRPGHIFPLIAREGGVFSRKGHTEAAVDLSRLAGCSPCGVICEIMNEDGSMARLPDLERFSQTHQIPIISVEDLIDYREQIADVRITLEASSLLPTSHGEFRMYSYTSEDPAVSEMVLLVSKGKGSHDRLPYVRVHSECLSGEAFTSLRCDCGPQLSAAMRIIGTEGGALLYLRQEGRGIGLIEKIRAYGLQDEGADTVEANLALGHGADERRYGAAAAVLKRHGLNRIKLMTNNPEKIAAVKGSGIEILEVVPLIEGVGPENRHYLHTKAEKFGHLLPSMEVV
jgi:3,4-dihydroxy 2-butanone 4-phosphate synthase / GTP cyclohydrolase II